MEAAQGVVEKEKTYRGRSPWLLAWQRFQRKKIAMLSLVVLLTVYLSGVFAPWIAPYSYTQQDLGNALKGPSREHLFGTDRLGRDMLSRLIWGARTTAIVSVASVTTGGLIFGIILGGLAGYLGRSVDTAIMRIGDMFFAFPGLLLIILVAATLKPRVNDFIKQVEGNVGLSGLAASGAVDYFVVFGALSFFAWPGMARLVRGQVLSIKERQFVEAAEALGASRWHIILRHVLPNGMSPVIVTVSMAMGAAVGSEVVLSWLGVGIQPPNASWGTMIFESQSLSVLRTYPHLLLMPVILVAIVIFAFNLLGDGLNDALNPRTR